MAVLNNEVTVAQEPSKATVAISLRRQSDADQQQFNEAVRILLSEWVRQHLDQRGGDHEATERS